ncbi:MAG: SagB/ThcOx family dehydrogenase [Bryobacteraceae bacterium]|nr:SagB/ThcOx family dehydrogenase [Bryobacteraceae bacterium]
MRFALLLVLPCLLSAQTLPPPATSGGMPLLSALKARSSAREFAAKPLPRQTLSNLLWAAYGVNRAASNGRTAPSAHGWQAVDLYVALPEGLFLYNAKAHSLELVSKTDAREISGTQDFVAAAPLNIVMVARMSKMKASPEDTQADLVNWAAIEAGAVSQNIYLYCASEGLSTVVRVGVQRPAFAKLAHLAPTDVILAAQTVGYPK